MAAISHWRPGMFVGGGDLVVNFEWDKKWFTENKKHTPIFVINVFILRSTGKKFPVKQHFPTPQTSVNVESIFQKSISVKPNTA